MSEFIDNLILAASNIVAAKQVNSTEDINPRLVANDVQQIAAELYKVRANFAHGKVNIFENEHA